jgi:hypothetical protein
LDSAALPVFTDIDVIIPRGTLKAGVRTNGDVPTGRVMLRVETTAAYCGIPAAGSYLSKARRGGQQNVSSADRVG